MFGRYASTIHNKETCLTIRNYFRQVLWSDYSSSLTQFDSPPGSHIRLNILHIFTPHRLGWPQPDYKGKTCIQGLELPCHQAGTRWWVWSSSKYDNSWKPALRGSCKDILFTKSINSPYIITTDCAFQKTRGAQPCQGDSGGPLMAHIGDRWYLAGLTSFSSNLCDHSMPIVLTRVSTFWQVIADYVSQDWITGLEWKRGFFIVFQSISLEYQICPSRHTTWYSSNWNAPDQITKRPVCHLDFCTVHLHEHPQQPAHLNQTDQPGHSKHFDYSKEL